ncbi:MAG: hypothetical protein DHS20C09_22450 [marine bacterium B5-7]|nr:MAG: hypothetical protein DHS20C09_22450 [marine bacterium B5-7]
MLKAMLILAGLIWNPMSFATPFDGIYSVNKFIEHEIRPSAPDIFVSPGTVFLTMQELADNTIVLTLLNTTTNQWQAYTSVVAEGTYVFGLAYTQTDYGVLIVNQEIELSFDEAGNGFFSHVLFLDPSRIIEGSPHQVIIDREPMERLLANTSEV